MVAQADGQWELPALPGRLCESFVRCSHLENDEQMHQTTLREAAASCWGQGGYSLLHHTSKCALSRYLTVNRRSIGYQHFSTAPVSIDPTSPTKLRSPTTGTCRIRCFENGEISDSIDPATAMLRHAKASMCHSGMSAATSTAIGLGIDR